jgi:hypothetical protein
VNVVAEIVNPAIYMGKIVKKEFGFSNLCYV